MRPQLWAAALITAVAAPSFAGEAPDRDIRIRAEGEAFAPVPIPGGEPVSAPLPFTPGEELVYKITALGMTAGKARISVGSSTKREGVSTWPVVVQARTDSIFDAVYSVQDRFVTWWDPETGRVIGNEFYANERGKRRRTRARLSHDEGKAEVFRLEEGSGQRSTRSYEIPAGAYDIAGAIMALRGRPLLPGTVEEVDVFDGKKVFRLRCIVEGQEKVKVGAGTYDAITARIQLGFDGNFKSKRDLKAWFSADDRRIPLRFEAEFALGSVVADLLTEQKGVTL